MLAFLAPIGASIAFVHAASTVVPAPMGSLPLYLAWWLGLSAAATGVLVAVDRAARRLLPLAALLKLSLVFPDQAPSRFKTAMRAGSTKTLSARLAELREADHGATAEAAERLLELVATLNTHDHVTRGHSERVRGYAVLIGEELGLDKEDVDLLNWSALLHDIGKLTVPFEILNKPGKPTEGEWTVLRNHPLYGEELVAPMRGWLDAWADAVGYHHERWDGGGYPRGTEGADIPLAGRIVAVADVYDVITSVRSYKKASGPVEGREEISRCAGSQFDPRVVRAFLNVSLGRMRMIMGPLSWLAHAPLLGRLPLTPLAGTITSALGVIAGASGAGLVAGPVQAVAAATPKASPAVVSPGPQAPAGVGGHHVRFAHHNPGTSAAPPSASPPAPPSAAPTAPVDAPPPSPPAPAALAAPTDSTTAQPDSATVVEGHSVVIDVLANDSNSRGASLELSMVDPPAEGTAVVVDNHVYYTAPNDFAGVATFVYRADARVGGTSGTATVTITIEPVNRAPSFVLGGDQTVAEDAGAQSVPGFASSISAGPLSEAAQSVSFSVSSDNNALFATQPAIATDGTLTYRPASNANGVAHVQVAAVDDGGTANGGVDRSAVQTFVITVTPVNDPPSFVGGGDQAVAVNAGPQSVSGWALQISPGPADESGQTVTFQVSNDHTPLFTAGGQPAVASDGTLTFTPATGAVGVANVTVRAHDDGGGNDTSAPVTFQIQVGSINHAPSFTAGSNQTVLEDAGVQTVSGWATAISPGPASDAGQTVSFTVTNDDNALFSAQPAVAQNGTLTYTPAGDANGHAQVTVTGHDNGGTAGGGVDTSASQTFTITVTAVNDAPSFTAGSNQTALEDAGAQTVAGWATAMSAGPSDESGQALSFSTSNDNNGLFSTQPAVAANGTLTYTAAANANGVANVTVTLQDNGGTANGGVDSSQQTLTITITPVNAAPSFTAGANQTVLSNAGTQTIAGWATGISAGPAEESGQTLSFNVSNDDNAIFDVQPAVDSSGTLTFTPGANTFGVANVTVTLQDSGGTANGGVDTSASQTFTITIQAPPVAADDAYQTTTLTPLSGNVLDNDSDPAGTGLTVQTSPQPVPSSGSVVLNSDGSFTYTPALAFVGTATFTYTVTDGQSLSATATASITVSTGLLPPNVLHLLAGSSSGEVWPVDTTASSDPTVADYDADGDPGLTIKDSDGKATINDPRKQQFWTYSPALPLILNGPVTLDLWAAAAGSNHTFASNKDIQVYAYLYDCDPTQTTCTVIAQNSELVKDWNSTPTWAHHQITVGTVALTTIAAGDVLKLRLLVGRAPVWVAMTNSLDSSLTLSVGP